MSNGFRIVGRLLGKGVGYVAVLVGRTFRRLLGLINSVDSRRLLRWMLAASTLLALVLVALGGFFGWVFEGVLNRVLYTFVALLPLWGIVLAALVLRRSWVGVETPDPVRSTPPEEGVTTATDSVGQSMERELTRAGKSQYYGASASPSEKEIRSTLREGAVRRTRTAKGHDRATARSIVAAGEWTDDQVAAAFLSEEVPYPLGERLRGMIDPGSAYLRRVRRTTAAIEAQTDDWGGDE